MVRSENPAIFSTRPRTGNSAIRRGPSTNPVSRRSTLPPPILPLFPIALQTERRRSWELDHVNPLLFVSTHNQCHPQTVTRHPQREDTQNNTLGAFPHHTLHTSFSPSVIIISLRSRPQTRRQTAREEARQFPPSSHLSPNPQCETVVDYVGSLQDEICRSQPRRRIIRMILHNPSSASNSSCKTEFFIVITRKHLHSTSLFSRQDNYR